MMMLMMIMLKTRKNNLEQVILCWVNYFKKKRSLSHTHTHTSSMSVFIWPYRLSEFFFLVVDFLLIVNDCCLFTLYANWHIHIHRRAINVAIKFAIKKWNHKRKKKSHAMKIYEWSWKKKFDISNIIYTQTVLW